MKQQVPLLANTQPEVRPEIFWTFDNSWVLTKRSLTHIIRNTDQLLSVFLMPVMFLLLFRYVFGGAINTGETSYVNFLVAGILVQTAAFGANTTTISVLVDLQRGIVDRFRALPMASSALLAAHVIADLARNTISAVIMLAAGFLVGFRPTADLVEWILVFGLLLLFTLAISWISAILGMGSNRWKPRSGLDSWCSCRSRLPAAPLSPLRACRPYCASSPRTSRLPTLSKPCAPGWSAHQSAIAGGWHWYGASQLS